MGALIGEVTKSTGISDATPALIIAGVIFVIAFVILLFTKIEEPEQAKVELSRFDCFGILADDVRWPFNRWQYRWQGKQPCNG